MAITDYSYLDAADATGRVFPTTTKPSRIQVTIDQPTLVSTTNSLTSQRRSLGAHRIQLEYTYPPMSADEMQPFIAFFNAMQGQGKAFKLNVPKELINDTTHIADSSTHTSTGSYAVGVREVTVDGFGNNLTTAIKGGNFIQFSNHDKIYVVAADGGSDGSGNCKIRFEPALLTAITSSETLNTFNQDIPMHAIFASDKIQFDVNSALLYGFKVNFVEQWTN
jgi:hypothetical protein|tara:strand:- start:148 stop:813 length:666 start_codon:yes stop_codon:yes gene_type:complete